MANTAKSLVREYIPRGAAMPTYMFPTQAAQATLKHGAGLTADASGHAGRFLVGERLAGFGAMEMEHKDRTDATAAVAGKDIPIIVDPRIRVSVTGQAAGCEYKAVFMSDDQTFTTVPQVGAYVGYIIYYDQTNELCTIICEPGKPFWKTWVSLADDESFALPAQAGILRVATDEEFATFHISATGTVTLPVTTVASTATIKTSAAITFVDPAAPTTTATITQLDISGGGATYSAAGPIDPDVPRNLIYNLTDGDTSITAGIITATGTDQNGDVCVEVIDMTAGLDQTGSQIFATLVSVELTGFLGSGAGDTLDMGIGAKLGLPMNGSGLTVQHVAVAGTEEAAAATDTTFNSVTTTTAPDGAKDIIVSYEYDQTVAVASVVTGGSGGTPNIAATDADTNLCVFDGGANATLRNRLGTTETVAIEFIGIQV